MTLLRCALLAFGLLPAAAHAGGFLFGENGARALGQGGAFTAQADDLTALQHNPAGLWRLQGFHFLVDANRVTAKVAFLRRDPAPEGELGNAPGNEVHNIANPSITPFGVLGYGTKLAGRPFHVAVGMYAPPSVRNYEYATPNYAVRVTDDGRERYDEHPVVNAPQRYGLIRSESVILFPTLAASYRLHDRVAIGAGLQYIYAHLQFNRAVTSDQITPQRQSREDPAWDSLVAMETRSIPSLTGLFGIQVMATDNLRFGASYRPPAKLRTRGTMDVELGRIARDVASVEGNTATLELTLPQEFHLGAYYQPLPQLGLSAQVVYQGWQSVDAFVLRGENIDITMLGNTVPFEELRIEKQWRHAWGGRLGAAWTFPFGLTARAGTIIEQSGIPLEHVHIDYPNFDRIFVTGGLDYPIGPITVALAGAYTPVQEREVTNSQVRAANTSPDVPGAIVGNGRYRSGGHMVGLGIRGSFGGGAGKAVPAAPALPPEDAAGEASETPEGEAQP